MGLILNLETATKVCSVSLALNGEEISKKEQETENFSHSENLNLFIIDVMAASNYELSDLDAISVSMGPGSYTGLRIGTSTAKGLCFGLDIPLIAISSLQSLAYLCTQNDGLICPMFDARRMEVYAAIYDADLNTIQAIEAKVIDETSYLDLLEKQKVYFIGPGAEKCQTMITHSNAIFNLNVPVSASGMNQLSEAKFNSKNFEDLAYFEPYYLKDFIAGKPKKLL